MSDLITADRLLAPVVAYGLPGCWSVLATAPLEDSEWRRLLIAVRRQRCAGQLLLAIADAALPATDSQRQEAQEVHLAAMARTLQLDRCLWWAADILDAADVDFRVLKGTAQAHIAYPDPALRQFIDVDLLIRGEDVDRSVVALTKAGCRRFWPQLRPGFDRRFGKCITFSTPDGYEIDLHRTLALGPFGLAIALPALFERSTPFAIGGRLFLALAAEERFLHACYHAVLGDVPPRLIPLRDVAQLLLAQDLDTERVLSVSAEWRGQLVIARAIRLAWERFDIADALPLTVWAQRYAPSRADQRALASYREVGRYSRTTLASLRAVPGITAKTAYVRALVFPQRSFLASRPGGYRDWIRRGRQRMFEQDGTA